MTTHITFLVAPKKLWALPIIGFCLQNNAPSIQCDLILKLKNKINNNRKENILGVHHAQHFKGRNRFREIIMLYKNEDILPCFYQSHCMRSIYYAAPNFLAYHNLFFFFGGGGLLNASIKNVPKN